MRQGDHVSKFKEDLQDELLRYPGFYGGILIGGVVFSGIVVLMLIAKVIF